MLNQNVVRVQRIPRRRTGGAERRAVVTIRCGTDNADLYDATIPLIERYATKCKADFIVIDDGWRTSEIDHPCALKTKCGAILESGYDRVLYMDGMDIFVRPDTPNLFEIVPADKLGAFDEAPICGERFDVARTVTMQEWIDSYNETAANKININPDDRYFNAGVLLFNAKTNPFQWGVKWFKSDYLYDQTCANVMVKLHNIPVHWLGREFNALLGIGIDEDPLPTDYLCHFCGPHGKPYMRGWLERNWVKPVARPAGAQTDGLAKWFRAAKPETMVEIGSAHGESSFIFTGLNSTLRITCIDPWEQCAGLADRYGAKARADFEKRHRWNPNVLAIQSTGHEAAQSWRGQVDAVYIDAIHEYEPVRQDIEDWLPFVRKGGAIGGHDYCDQFPGVMLAVNELFGGPDQVFEDSSWLVIKK